MVRTKEWKKKEFCRKHVQCKEKLLVLKKKMPCSSFLSLSTMSKAPFAAFSFGRSSFHVFLELEVWEWCWTTHAAYYANPFNQVHCIM